MQVRDVVKPAYFSPHAFHRFLNCLTKSCFILQIKNIVLNKSILLALNLTYFWRNTPVNNLMIFFHLFEGGFQN